MAFGLRPRKPTARSTRGRHRGPRTGQKAPASAEDAAETRQEAPASVGDAAETRSAGASGVSPALGDPVFQQAPAAQGVPPVRFFSEPPTVPFAANQTQPTAIILTLDQVDISVAETVDPANASLVLRSRKHGFALKLVGRREQWSEIIEHLRLRLD